MYVSLQIVFHVENNSDDDINIFRYIGDAISISSWFLKAHKG